MHFTSKKISLLILGLTSIACSKAFFLALDDPEGANLLVSIGMAAIVYFASLPAYVFGPATTAFKKLPLAIFVQIAITGGLYFFLS